MTADNFGGQGEKFNETIRNFGKFSQTLSDNREEFFGSTRALQGFVSTLAETTRRCATSTSRSPRSPPCSRASARSCLRRWATSAVALGEVSTFVRDNQEILGRNIEGLNRFTKVLAKQRDSLDEILNIAPTALNNLALTYNPQAGTLDTRSNLGEIGYQISSDPATFLCGFVNQADTSGADLRHHPGRPSRGRAPSSGSRARTPAGRTSSTRRSADSWR